MCILNKKFIDVKISAWVTNFSHNTEFVIFSPQNLHSDFYLYILEGLFKKKRKRKKKNIIA